MDNDPGSVAKAPRPLRSVAHFQRRSTVNKALALMGYAYFALKYIAMIIIFRPFVRRRTERSMHRDHNGSSSVGQHIASAVCCSPSFGDSP